MKHEPGERGQASNHEEPDLDEKIKNKIVDARGFSAEILEQVEIWPPGPVKGQDFSIYNRVLGEIVECLDDMRELPVE